MFTPYRFGNPAAMGGAAAVTLTIQPDGTAGKDNHLREAVPTTNAGTSTTMLLRYTGGGAGEYIAIAFDLSAIPANATIVSASLFLYCTAVGNVAANTRVELYQLLRNWTEAGSTWNTYDGTNNWTTAGAASTGNDRSATIAAHVVDGSWTANAFNEFVFNANGLALVTGWVNGTINNYGVLAAHIAATANNTLTIASSDNATAANRPKFVVVYTAA